MKDKFCPAGRIECETLDWVPDCAGVTIRPTETECIRPSRQRPPQPETKSPAENFVDAVRKLNNAGSDRDFNLGLDAAIAAVENLGLNCKIPCNACHLFTEQSCRVLKSTLAALAAVAPEKIK